MTGTVSSVSGSTVKLTHGNKPESSHEVAADATVTLNGKPAKLADLKAGDTVSLSGDPATSVSATR